MYAIFFFFFSEKLGKYLKAGFVILLANEENKLVNYA